MWAAVLWEPLWIPKKLPITKSAWPRETREPGRSLLSKKPSAPLVLWPKTICAASAASPPATMCASLPGPISQATSSNSACFCLRVPLLVAALSKALPRTSVGLSTSPWRSCLPWCPYQSGWLSKLQNRRKVGWLGCLAEDQRRLPLLLLLLPRLL